MNIKDLTSPSVSAPPAAETPTSAESKDPTTPSAEQLSSSLTREFDLLKELIKENREIPKEKVTTNPAVLVVLTFLLTGLAGNVVTFFLTIRQQRLAAERSFIDESNKLRIPKIAEVWEQLDQDEHAIAILLDPNDDIVAKFPTPTDRAGEIERIIRNDRAVVSKYRYWLGKKIAEKIDIYLNANIRYSIKKLAGSSEADLKTERAAREAAKSDVDQIREELLREVLTSGI